MAPHPVTQDVADRAVARVDKAEIGGLLDEPAFLMEALDPELPDERDAPR